MTKDKQIEITRHSLAHIMAAAVLELFPEAKIGMGPAIENGFYYDFDLPRTLIPEDLPIIEEKMLRIIKENQAFEKEAIKLDEAIERLKKIDQNYKIEILKDLKKEGEEEVFIYKTGNFIDLCKGPHLESTGEIKPKTFKLEKTSGAYWKGDEKNKMLQRIYGIAFLTPKELRQYEALREEAKKRDHRKLGKELDLFVNSSLIGPGLPIFTPKGFIIRNEIVNYSRELNKKIGYQEIYTPNINKAELFKISGHYDKYKDDMLEVKSHYTKEEYFLKPMNCPQATQVYASKKRSYKDLPIKYADFANVYRDEKPGELGGLSRVKYFSVDDGHCFCREDQVKEEFIKVLDVIKEALKGYKLDDYWIRLSLWDENEPEKYLGDKKTWDENQDLLREILKESGTKYKEAIGEAAFYGPKVDVMVKDCLNREWQICTLQIDKAMPERFDLKYTDKDGQEKRPVMLHRGIIGSAERLMSILIEEYAGAFPLWLSPVQVKLISVSEKFEKEVNQMKDKFEAEGIRIEADLKEESVGKKISEAIIEKVPYMIVLGEKELKSGKLAVRKRGQKKVEEYDFKDFIKILKTEIETKA